MKKYLVVFILSFVLGAVTYPICASAAESKNIIQNNDSGIPDKVLYQAVLKALGKSKKSTFTKEEAAAVKELDIANHTKNNKVKSIKGIEHLVGLQTLDISNNHLKSLKYVEGLTNLEVFRALDCGLKKLPNLVNLKKLSAHDTYFQYNQISFNKQKVKLPSQLKKNKSWLKEQIRYQNISRKLKLTKPNSINRIFKNTSKIKGRAQKGAKVELFDIKAVKRIKSVKVNAKGVFTLNKLNLKKYKGKKLRLSVYIYSNFYKENDTIKSLYFKIK